MVLRWKLLCASTGVLIIPGIRNTPLHVAADMLDAIPFFFLVLFFVMLSENKQKILTIILLVRGETMIYDVSAWSA